MFKVGRTDKRWAGFKVGVLEVRYCLGAWRGYYEWDGANIFSFTLILISVLAH